MKKAAVLILTGLFIFSSLSAENVQPDLNLLLKQFKDGSIISAADIPDNTAPFLKKYMSFIIQGQKQSSKDKSDKAMQMIFSNYNTAEFEFGWKDEITEDREKAFYFLSLAQNTLKTSEKELAVKFFFQAFYLYVTWKSTNGLVDRVVFLNEFYYHFYNHLSKVGRIELPLERGKDDTSDYYHNLIISSCDLLYNLPYYFFIHKQIGYEFVNRFISRSSEIILDSEPRFKLLQNKDLKSQILKMFVINSTILILEKNFIKADQYIARTLDYLADNPITEDLFVIYEEALKNKILVMIKFSNHNESAEFLRKFLTYSEANNKLREKWTELKELIDNDEKGKQFIKNQKVKDILNSFKLI